MMSNFSSYSQIFCYLLLDFHVKTGTRFSPRDNRIFEITEFEITRVDCNNFYSHENGTIRMHNAVSGLIWV